MSDTFTRPVLNISADTQYLHINNMPLTVAAAEQLERAWYGKNLDDTKWLCRVVITHDVGDQHFAHELAIGQKTADKPDKLGTIRIVELVAVRISELMEEELKSRLQQLHLALLMF